jgi:hypothetical protein
MNIEKLINEVIPPADYQHRNGFNNIPLVEGLTLYEKQLLEKGLIKKLELESMKEIDILIVETLAYLKSKESLPVLYQLIESSRFDIVKLQIATSIFEINQDPKMIDIAISAFKEIDNIKDAYHVYAVSGTFYHLSKFKNERIKQIIKEYTSHSEYLISYNAKQYLEY